MAQSTYNRRTQDGVSAGADQGSDQLGMLTDQATEQLSNIADAMEDLAARVVDQSRAAGEQLYQVAGNIGGAVDKSIREQPMATLAVVTALGFVLGAIWKR